MTDAPATAISLTPDPAALLSPELTAALCALEREMLRRANDYETPTLEPVGAKNLSPHSSAAARGAKKPSSSSRRDRPYAPEEHDSPFARRRAREERRRLRAAARYAPTPASIPQPAPADPRSRERRFDADTRYLMRFCSIRKTILEAHRLNPNAAPLPDFARFLPDELVRIFTLAEKALCEQILSWESRGVRPCQLEFDPLLSAFSRVVAIRKSLLDLSRIAPPPPPGFPGWNADKDRDPFNDPDPPITPPGCAPLPVDDEGYPLALGRFGTRPRPAATRPDAAGGESAPPADFSSLISGLSALLHDAGAIVSAEPPASAPAPICAHPCSSVVLTSSDPSPASPAFQPSFSSAPAPASLGSDLSNLNSEISTPSSEVPSPICVHPCSSVVLTSSPVPPARTVPSARSLRALSLFLLSRAQRLGAALVYLRPMHKNRLIFRFGLAILIFIANYDSTLADPLPSAVPDESPPPTHLASDFGPGPPPLPAT